MSLLVSMVYKVKQLKNIYQRNFTQNVFKTGFRGEIRELAKRKQLTQSSNGERNEEPSNSDPQEKTLVIPDDDDFFQRDPKCMLHTGNDIYVVDKTYNDKLHIHIRQYNRYGEQTYPTKKGVTLYLSKWCMLECLKEDLDKYFQDYDKGTVPEEERSIHLGGGIYISINNKYPILNIRHWWKPDEDTDPRPTKEGVILTEAKWNQLKDVMSIIRDFVPELNDASVGCPELDYQNQLGMLRCKERNPFECGMY